MKQPFAVIDVGSNSLRLVVYSHCGLKAEVLHDVRAVCGLGEGLRETGMLSPAGRERVLDVLQEFASKTREFGIVPNAVGTAAMRDARDGREFAQEVEAQTGISVRVLSGEEEARLVGFGVRYSLRGADGVACDMGGGSTEFVCVHPDGVGGEVSVPLGFASVWEEVDVWLEQVRFVPHKPFYLVGGALRALAKRHQARVASREKIFPLQDFARTLALVREGEHTRGWEELSQAARVVERCLYMGRVSEVVVVATGLREGVLLAAAGG